MANFRQDTTLKTAYLRPKDASIGHLGRTTVQGTYAPGQYHLNYGNERKTAVTALPNIMTPPPEYKAESRVNLNDGFSPATEYGANSLREYPYNQSGSQKLSFWRTKRGILLIVVLSNIVILVTVLGGVFGSRHSLSNDNGVVPPTDYPPSTSSLYPSPPPQPQPSTSGFPTGSASQPNQHAGAEAGVQSSGSVINGGNSQGGGTGSAGGTADDSSGPRNPPGKGGK